MPEAFYKKLNLSKDKYVNLIKDLYFNKEFSQSQIAEYLGCHITTIEQVFKRNDIQGRDASNAGRVRRNRNCDIPLDEMEIINGMMLSDFHIEKNTYQARFAFCFKYREFAEYFTENIKSISWGEVKQQHVSQCWGGKSRYYKEVMDLRRKWYPNGKKIVPRDLKITPKVLLFWFLGDGMKSGKDSGASLCTDDFSKEDNLFLVEQLTNIGFNCYLTTSNRIHFSGNQELKKLISFIGECPVKCYYYKFKYEQKNPCNRPKRSTRPTSDQILSGESP